MLTQRPSALHYVSTSESWAAASMPRDARCSIWVFAGSSKAGEGLEGLLEASETFLKSISSLPNPFEFSKDMPFIASFGIIVDGTSVRASVEAPLGSARATESEERPDWERLRKPSDDTLLGSFEHVALDNSVEVVPLESWRRVTFATFNGSSLTPSPRLIFDDEFLSSSWGGWLSRSFSAFSSARCSFLFCFSSCFCSFSKRSCR